MIARRIFIAINLPEEIKKKLSDCQERWWNLPLRLTKPANLHLTVVFIGYVNDQEMFEICQMTRGVAKNYSPFILNFNRICLGPAKRPPRLIWLEGEKNQNLIDLKNQLEENLFGLVKKIKIEKRDSLSHITLARIRQREWQGLQDKPARIDEKISLSFPVESIEVMESELKRDGAEYTILELCPFEGNL